MGFKGFSGVLVPGLPPRLRAPSSPARSRGMVHVAEATQRAPGPVGVRANHCGSRFAVQQPLGIRERESVCVCEGFRTADTASRRGAPCDAVAIMVPVGMLLQVSAYPRRSRSRTCTEVADPPCSHHPTTKRSLSRCLRSWSGGLVLP